ncbi:MAG: alanine racemase [Tissierellaceae bacterium]|jgi:alanine racemase|nr:alanine racemase [Tissierellia bacterium]
MEQLKEVRPVRLEIDLDNLTNNIKEIRRHVGDSTLIMAIVKANAYGHGAAICGRIFLDNGADKLGVSVLSEGISLRESGITAPILVLNYTPTVQYEELLRYDLTQTIYKYEDAKLLSEIAGRYGKDAKIHIKIDTGMHRIGFLPNETSIDDIRRIVELPNISVEGIYTHFAKADYPDKSHTRDQFQKFQWVLDRLADLNIDIPIKHASNSAAILDLPEYNLDMVRPGIILYGHYPSEHVNKDVIDIKPTTTLKSCISHIKELDEGEGIGYGQTFVTKRKSKIATLPIGYADGFSRVLSGRAYVSINHKRVPVVGTICMDQLMVDVTDIENIGIDDEAILFGYGHESYPRVEDIAKELGTINYELICMISIRVPRIYINMSGLIDIEEISTK